MAHNAGCTSPWPCGTGPTCGQQLPTCVARRSSVSLTGRACGLLPLLLSFAVPKALFGLGVGLLCSGLLDTGWVFTAWQGLGALQGPGLFLKEEIAGNPVDPHACRGLCEQFLNGVSSSKRLFYLKIKPLKSKAENLGSAPSCIYLQASTRRKDALVRGQEATIGYSPKGTQLSLPHIPVSQAAVEGPPGIVCWLQSPPPLGAQDHHSCADHTRLQPPRGLHQCHHRPHQRALPPGRAIPGEEPDLQLGWRRGEVWLPACMPRAAVSSCPPRTTLGLLPLGLLLVMAGVPGPGWGGEVMTEQRFLPVSRKGGLRGSGIEAQGLCPREHRCRTCAVKK